MFLACSDLRCVVILRTNVLEFVSKEREREREREREGERGRRERGKELKERGR